jgi:hypothetical protein
MTCDEVERIDFENMSELVKAIAIGCSTIISGSQTPRILAGNWR